MSIKKAANEAKATVRAARESVHQEQAAKQHAGNAAKEVGKSIGTAIFRGVKNFLDVKKNPPRGGMTHGKK